MRNGQQVILQQVNMHTPQSHEKDNRKFLKHQQSIAIFTALQASPRLTPVEVPRNIKNFSPSKYIDAARLTSVRRADRKLDNSQSCLTSLEFPDCNVQLTYSHGSFTSFCQRIFLSSVIERHNDNDSDIILVFIRLFVLLTRLMEVNSNLCHFCCQFHDYNDDCSRFPAVHKF